MLKLEAWSFRATGDGDQKHVRVLLFGPRLVNATSDAQRIAQNSEIENT